MNPSLQTLLETIVTACVTIVTAMTPVIIIWLKNYLAVQQTAAMNQTIQASAARIGATLVSSVPPERLTRMQVGDPFLRGQAIDLLRHYPDFAKKLGMDENKAQRVILGEAHKILNNKFPDVPRSVQLVPPEPNPTHPPHSRPPVPNYVPPKET